MVSCLENLVGLISDGSYRRECWKFSSLISWWGQSFMAFYYSGDSAICITGYNGRDNKIQLCTYMTAPQPHHVSSHSRFNVFFMTMKCIFMIKHSNTKNVDLATILHCWVRKCNILSSDYPDLSSLLWGVGFVESRQQKTNISIQSINLIGSNQTKSSDLISSWPQSYNQIEILFIVEKLSDLQKLCG